MKHLSFILLACVSIGLTACGGDSSASSQEAISRSLPSTAAIYGSWKLSNNNPGLTQQEIEQLEFISDLLFGFRIAFQPGQISVSSNCGSISAVAEITSSAITILESASFEADDCNLSIDKGTVQYSIDNTTLALTSDKGQTLRFDRE